MSKITQYEPLPDPAVDDLLAVVDVSDQSMAYSGTDKKAAVGSLPFLPSPSGTPSSGQVPAATGSGQASAWTTLTALGAAPGTIDGGSASTSGTGIDGGSAQAATIPDQVIDGGRA